MIDDGNKLNSDSSIQENHEASGREDGADDGDGDGDEKEAGTSRIM